MALQGLLHELRKGLCKTAFRHIAQIDYEPVDLDLRPENRRFAAAPQGAVLDGREVMLFGSYGGMMRGGNTDATIVVGDGDRVHVDERGWRDITLREA